MKPKQASGDWDVCFKYFVSQNNFSNYLTENKCCFAYYAVMEFCRSALLMQIMIRIWTAVNICLSQFFRRRIRTC